MKKRLAKVTYGGPKRRAADHRAAAKPPVATADDAAAAAPIAPLSPADMKLEQLGHRCDALEIALDNLNLRLRTLEAIKGGARS